MKKLFRGDYFYFSKSDRRAAFVLLIIICVVNIVRIRSDRPIPVETVAHVDSIFPADTISTRRYYTNRQTVNRKPDKVVQKVKNYSPDTIKFHKRPIERSYDSIVVKNSVYSVKKTPLSALDVNTVDSATLVTLPGIGPHYARKILEYRDLLGGYVDVQQLRDIDGLQDSILRWFVVTDTVPVRKVNINRLSVSKLSNHPYISFYQARAISEYRRSEGDIKNPAPLSLMEEFTEQDIIRLEPYLSFE